MSLAGSASVDRFHGNKKRPPTARQRRIEGLTTRRGDLLMASTHPMYLCPQTGGNFPRGKGRTDG
jgi:hypothetical protein